MRFGENNLIVGYNQVEEEDQIRSSSLFQGHENESKMAKYSKKAQATVASAVRKMKKGTLKSGSGEVVTDPKQAIAIGISEADKKGYKVPKNKST